ncbi:rhodanese-like domain-containing protein [Hydrogenimonas sp.]
MKKIIFSLLFFTSLIFAEVRDLNIASFEKLKSRGIPVIDIRTAEEWKETGIISGVHTITFFKSDGSYDLKEFISRLQRLGIDKETPFILVCRSAHRTRLLGNHLSDELGYRNVYELTGGILNWKRHKKPFVPYRP